MSDLLFTTNRNSKMEIGEIYFWTNTIKDWNKLLHHDEYKRIIMESLKFLTQKKFVTIYSFVIMPNHMHLVWKINEKNGKELPHASFNKFTAHEILNDLKVKKPNLLTLFKVEEPERKFRI